MPKKHLDVTESVMSRIEREHIPMRPRWHFVIGSLALAASVIGSMVLSAFLISVIAFSIRTHGPMGEVRFQQLVSGFPWWALVTAAAGLVLGTVLLKRYDFAYKYNFGVIAAAIVLTVIMAGWILNTAGIDSLWIERGPMRQFYRRYDGGWRAGNGSAHEDNRISPGFRRGKGRSYP